MAFRPDSPFELPNGRLVCGPHRLGVCAICTVDYDFLYEGEDEEHEEESDDSDYEIDPRGFMPSDSSPAEPDSSQASPGFAFTGFALMPPRLLSAGSSGSSSSNINTTGPKTLIPRYNFTGRVIPEKFVPPLPEDRPQDLFPLSDGQAPSLHPSICARFIRANNKRQFLIYTDGACSENGGADARGGCSFVYKNSTQIPGQHPKNGLVSFPLEKRGPTGEVHQHTSNRAELRAVIAALRFRLWDGEGFTSLVIATDSEYVAHGATQWVKAWLRNGWKTRTGATVKNQDLWKCLFGQIEECDRRGLRVQFWRIPRQWNVVADQCAKEAVHESPGEGFNDIFGVLT
jgi:ribonuclease HI